MAILPKAFVKLTHEDINSGNPVTVLCNSVNVSGKKNVNATPEVNSTSIVEAQTQSYENLIFSINGIHFTGASGTLTWDNLLTLYKSKYGGTNYITMNVTYGKTNGTLTGLTGCLASTDIKTVVKSISFPITAAQSDGGYMPVGNVVLSETK